MRNVKYPIALGTVFAYLFFPLSAGLNVFVFDAIALLTLFASRPELTRRPAVRWAVFLLLASAVSVVIVHAPASLVAHHLSFLLLIGFVQERELRFIWYGLLLGVFSLLAGPTRFLRQLHGRYAHRLASTNRWVWVRPGLTALAVSLPFFLLYSIGNSDFFRGLEWLLGWLDGVHRFDEPLRFAVLFVVGLCGTIPLILAGANFDLAYDDTVDPDTLSRSRGGNNHPFSPLALRVEYRRAVMVFLTLNALLWVVNLTDLRYIWLSATELPASTLSEYVHAGTNSLMASILLAMVVVLYFFRRNLNFYPNARTLRALTYCWLAQNAFLALSVGMRNWHYIHAYGLAIGRVHVGVALCLVLVGIFSLSRKVRQRRSLHYLLQVNGLAAWLFLVGYGAVNWSGVITRVNLRQPTHRIDWTYLVDDLDRDNYFLLRQEQERLPTRLAGKLERYGYPAQDWRSWNYADWRNTIWGAGAREQ
ncbi:uncharacterized protein DUF4173 [Neolewinella xylanilytica]|uniref:Uncharacterized protein DUF4173 n=1 Tax=Neolewinella xylanilytica TaxID=1514080 RepID=A0A2S6I5K8_9BACT|nr:DUF4173 domain-containing protein [Neolewinella xylanilytica]PPK86371.1 uncharacterized protein DUF4173 [Neolewinella xylanilytica]